MKTLNEKDSSVYAVLISAIAAGILLIAGALVYTVNAYSCGKYSASNLTIPPSGYGAVYDVFDNAKRTLLSVDCDVPNTTLSVGYGNQAQIIYEEGYVYSGNQWHKVNFSGGNKYVVGGVSYPWYIGSASVQIPASLTSPTTFYVAFLCTAQAGKWKCGCRDFNCATSHWQLQSFDTNTSGGGGLGSGGSGTNLPINPRGDCNTNFFATYCYNTPKCFAGEVEFNAPGYECFSSFCGADKGSQVGYVGKRACCTVNGIYYCEACYTQIQGRFSSPKCEQIRG